MEAQEAQKFSRFIFPKAEYKWDFAPPRILVAVFIAPFVNQVVVLDFDEKTEKYFPLKSFFTDGIRDLCVIPKSNSLYVTQEKKTSPKYGYAGSKIDDSPTTFPLVTSESNIFEWKMDSKGEFETSLFMKGRLHNTFALEDGTLFGIFRSSFIKFLPMNQISRRDLETLREHEIREKRFSSFQFTGRVDYRRLGEDKIIAEGCDNCLNTYSLKDFSLLDQNINLTLPPSTLSAGSTRFVNGPFYSENQGFYSLVWDLLPRGKVTEMKEIQQVSPVLLVADERTLITKEMKVLKLMIRAEGSATTHDRYEEVKGEDDKDDTTKFCTLNESSKPIGKGFILTGGGVWKVFGGKLMNVFECPGHSKVCLLPPGKDALMRPAKILSPLIPTPTAVVEIITAFF